LRAQPAPNEASFTPSLVIPAGVAERVPPPPNEALFRQLVHDHRQRLYRFVVKHIGWSSDAEDLTQQAFVEAAHSYATFRGASELSTWLYRLVQVPEGMPLNEVRFSKRLD
jgi:hypothetical protein